MIEAVFDGANARSGAVSGAYQYDIGQRLVMHGLPSPQELAGRDDLLSGDLVTVQAQFSYKGDSQTEMRLAMWDEKRGVWLVDVPDDYLTRHRDVHVYVFCYYGADETGERAETVYEAAFRPISRPAPSGTVTEEQLSQWADLKEEIEISMARVLNAVDGASGAAADVDAAGDRAEQAGKNADAEAQEARNAMDELTAAGSKVGRADGAVKDLPTGSEATAEIDLSGDVGWLAIGTPIGKNGKKGETGDTGPDDVRFEFDAATGTLSITTRTDEDTGEE